MSVLTPTATITGKKKEKEKEKLITEDINQP